MSRKSIAARGGIVGAAVLVVSALIIPLGGSAHAKKPCPVNSTTDYFVNPAAAKGKDKDKDKDKGEPTGVSSPAECSYPTITEALSALDAQGTGGRVIVIGAESGTATFSNETFPLSVPEGVTLTTSDDTDLGGTGLDPTRYVVEFDDGVANALHLQGGDVKGVTLKSERSVNASAMVTCGSGSSALEAVTLDGASAGGGQIDRGLDLSAGCDTTADRVRVRNFGGPGVVVDDGADLSLTSSKVHNNGGDGLTIRGETAISLSEFAFNGDDGILVEASTSSVFDNNIVRDNLGNGFEIHQSAVSFGGNRIFSNSGTVGWDQPQVLFVGPSDPYGVPFFTGSSYVLAYQFGPEDCDAPGANPNQIHTYNTATDPVGSSEGSVGLYASQGAVVAADNNSWRTGVPSQNVDQDAASIVDANTICPAGGIILQSAPIPGPPVE